MGRPRGKVLDAELFFKLKFRILFSVDVARRSVSIVVVKFVEFVFFELVE